MILFHQCDSEITGLLSKAQDWGFPQNFYCAQGINTQQHNKKNKAEWILQVQSFWQEDYTAEGAVALCYFFPSSISIAVAANYSKMSL